MPGSLVLLSTDFQGKGGSSQGIPTVSQDKASCSWFIIVPFPVDVEDHTGFPNVPGEAPPPHHAHTTFREGGGLGFRRNLGHREGLI